MEPDPKKKLSINDQFLSALKRQLILHLNVADNPKFGKQLYITPFDCRVTAKIRRLLATVEGEYVFDLKYFPLLELFKNYCMFWFPIHYYKRFMGVQDIRFLDC